MRGRTRDAARGRAREFECVGVGAFGADLHSHARTHARYHTAARARRFYRSNRILTRLAHNAQRFVVPAPDPGACAWDTLGLASQVLPDAGACGFEYEIDDVVVVNECTRQF